MRRTDKPLLQGGRRLDGHALIPEGLVKAAATRTEGLGQATVGLRRMDRIRVEATGIQDGTVGPPALAALLIRSPQCRLEQLQGAQDAEGPRSSSTRGGGREPCGATRRAGAHPRGPGPGVRPLAEGMHDGDNIGNLQVGSGTAQPLREIMHKAQRPCSCYKGGTSAAGDDEGS